MCDRQAGWRRQCDDGNEEERIRGKFELTSTQLVGGDEIPLKCRINVQKGWDLLQ